MKKAPTTGIARQDGSYLAELLLDGSYEARGVVRRSLGFDTDWVYRFYRHPHGPEAKMFLRYDELRRVTSEPMGWGLEDRVTEAVADEPYFVWRSGGRPGEENKGSFIRNGIACDRHNRSTIEFHGIFDRHAVEEPVCSGDETEHTWSDGVR